VTCCDIIEALLQSFFKHISEFQKIKSGAKDPERCEDYGCDFCASTKIITEPIDTDLFGMSAAQIKGMTGAI
jgi:hypothetical protein